jgi:potassium-transporting ATPase potassium-binding subunit
VTGDSWALLAAFLACLLAIAHPLGAFMARLLDAGPGRARAPRAFYRLCGVDPAREMGWLDYALALLLFNAIGAAAAYLIQRTQFWLPLNPQRFANVAPDSAFNTALSFVTNTDWQDYAGESTLSHLTQMLALAVQNFLSAATGIAVAIALIRGFARHGAATIGNAWVDLVRIVVGLLLPLSVVLALVLCSQGVVQDVAPFASVATVEQAADGARKTQSLPTGPVASQEAIKLLGTNGGGVFNANSAHPYENPTALTNFLQMLAILAIPAGLCFTFGHMVKDRRQGWTILGAMALLFVAGAVAAMAFEQQGNPRFAALGIDQAHGALQAGGNMEGKETRFGSAASGLFAAVTTAASCGAVDAMHDSFTALGGLVPLVNMQLGEVVFGGVGAGLYGMLVFAVLAVFIAGLMIGRTPEYLGKKVEAHEMKMSSIAILVTPLLVLVGTAVAVLTDAGRAAIANPGPHGFSELLYALTSAANNNGSAFAGVSVDTPFWNVLLALAMWFGRFAVIVPVLAMAGSLAAKKRLAPGPGTMPSHGPLFATLLIGTVLLVGLLNYVPALALGPIVEHLLLWK